MEELKSFFKPFNLYDIFGYLLPGVFFIGIILFEYDFGDLLNFYVTNPYEPFSFLCVEDYFYKFKFYFLFKFLTWGTPANFKFSIVLAFIIFCYLVGHVISAISSFLIERFFVKGFLKFPSENLIEQTPFDESQRIYCIRNPLRKFFQAIFSDFSKPLDKDFSKELEKAIRNKFGNSTPRNEYFWLCFSFVSHNSPTALNRVLHFLNLYAFSRNISMCFFLYIGLRLSLHCFLPSDLNLYNKIILLMYLFTGCLMFWNYLKLFKRQCRELYTHFYFLATASSITTKS